MLLSLRTKYAQGKLGCVSPCQNISSNCCDLGCCHSNKPTNQWANHMFNNKDCGVAVHLLNKLNWPALCAYPVCIINTIHGKYALQIWINILHPLNMVLFFMRTVYAWYSVIARTRVCPWLLTTIRLLSVRTVYAWSKTRCLVYELCMIYLITLTNWPFYIVSMVTKLVMEWCCSPCALCTHGS